MTAAPERWVLVPRKAAAEQIEAIEFALYRYADCSARDAERGAPYVYAAMLDAAPQPPPLDDEAVERAARAFWQHYNGQQEPPGLKDSASAMRAALATLKSAKDAGR